MIKVKYLEYTEVNSVILHSGGRVISTGTGKWMNEVFSNITKLEIHEFENGTLYIRATAQEETQQDGNRVKVHKYASYRGDYTIIYLDEEIME